MPSAESMPYFSQDLVWDFIRRSSAENDFNIGQWQQRSSIGQIIPQEPTSNDNQPSAKEAPRLHIPKVLTHHCDDCKQDLTAEERINHHFQSHATRALDRPYKQEVFAGDQDRCDAPSLEDDSAADPSLAIAPAPSIMDAHPVISGPATAADRAISQCRTEGKLTDSGDASPDAY
eukprot:Rmarinus@m.6228